MPTIPTIFEYLLKLNLSLIVLGALYWFVLRKETFHRLNRWTMLGILLGSLALPIVMLRQSMINNPMHRLAELWQPAPAETPALANMAPEPALPSVFTPAEMPAAVAPEVPAAELEAEPATAPLPSREQNRQVWPWLIRLYWLVAAMLGLRLLIQFLSVGRLLYRSNWQNAPILFNDRVTAPFSFFNWIVLNPGQYSDRVRSQIIAHEKVHAREGHTADILLTEILTVFCWFNPMIWKLKKAIRLNLEFIADEAILRSGQDKKEYQYNLLKSIVPDYQLMLANHFNHSFIKNRIAMMNSKKSPAQSKWKYLFILPAVLGLMLVFSPVDAQNPVQKTPAEPLPAPTPAPAVEPVAVPAAVQSAEPLPAPVAEPAGISNDGRTRVAVRTSGVAGVTASSSGSGSSSAGVGRSTGGATRAVAGSGTGAVGGYVPSAPTRGTSNGIARAEAPAQGEDIFIVVRSDTQTKTFEDIKRELSKRNIDFDYSNLHYDESGKLTQVSMAVKVGDQYNGKLDGYNNGNPLTEPLVIYLMKDKHSFGVSNGIPDNLEEGVQYKMEGISGLWITNGKSSIISGNINTANFGKNANKNTDEVRTGTAGRQVAEKENIFVVISRNTTKEDIRQLEADLGEKGLFIHFSKLEFTRDGRITSVRLEVKDDHGLSGNLSNTYDMPEDRIYIYRFYDGDGGFGIGIGSHLDQDKKMPQSVKKAIKDTNSGYKIGTF